MSYPRGTTLDVMEVTKMRRKNYTCELKLEVVAFYRDNNLYHNSNSVSVLSISWFSIHSEYFPNNRTSDLLEYIVAVNDTLHEIDRKIAPLKDWQPSCICRLLITINDNQEYALNIPWLKRH